MGQLVFQATAGGQVALVGPNPSSNFSLNVPAVNGNLVTTGDTGTVTNTMLASSAYTAPGTIGSGTPNSGAFTTLSASSTVSGTGFSTYLASPPAIGGTSPSTGKFTSITNTGLTSGYVVYAGTGGLESGSSNLFWDSTNGRLGIGTSSPTGPLDIVGSVSRVRWLLNNSYAYQEGLNAAGSAYADFVYDGNSHQWQISSAERMRIDSSGNVGIGGTSSGARLWVQSSSNTEGTELSRNTAANTYNTIVSYVVQAEGFNSSATALKVGKNSSTSRSINAGGTVNAAGLDYAEYMVKADNFTINKGDICGIDAKGKLTNLFGDAVSFVVKSTNPSYVGGDTWGIKSEDKNNKYTSEELEVERQKVDRIAFAGQVPVNVIGATAGQYIIPINDNGSIKGEAVSNPTFEQYQIAVGKIIAIESDGRAKIIVKVA